MEEFDLADKIRAMMKHYNLNASQMAERVGGSRGTVYNLLVGKNKPDYKTMQAMLREFTEISAEWLMRGEGPMLRGQLLSQTEAQVILSKMEMLQEMYREAILRSDPKGKN